MNRRGFLKGVTAGTSAWAAGVGVPLSGDDPAPHPPAPAVSNHRIQESSAMADLAAPTFRPLPLGAVRPRGWLLRQLRIQADGLSGHLDEFWPDVGQSQWFGGQAEGWERAPYWLDGVIPLAWLLDDAALMAKVSGYIGRIVEGQRADGWFAPYPADAAARRYDLWAILLANKMLVQYHEATGDERVLRAVQSSLRAMAAGLDRTPLYDWGRFRWFEGLIPAFYLHERTGEPWLLDLARKLRDQGFDYPALYASEEIRVPTPRRGLWTYTRHVVNTGMAAKAGALSWRLDRRVADRAFPAQMIEILDRHHGQVTGMFSGDECLAGKNPVQGTELCAVVEFMYSLEILLSVFGDAAFGDRLERVAFNALPATFTPDMWAHQYDQQANQVQCTINPEHMWTTNGPESNLYGLEPNFGCCTANMHQGWPKFAAHLLMEAPADGLAVVAYAPCETRIMRNGHAVSVAVDTEYPFRETVTIAVTPEATVRVPLLLRVPGWADGATVQVEGDAAVRMEPGTFHRLDREWRGPTRVTLRFPMRPRITTRYNESASIERGPLVYSLAIEEEWTRVNADKPHRELPHGDFEVRPASPWNCALLLDRGEASLRFEERPIGERPFSPEGAGMAAKVQGRVLPDWKLRHGWAAEIAPGEKESAEPLEELTLIPYGCTNIRVTEFPRLKA